MKYEFNSHEETDINALTIQMKLDSELPQLIIHCCPTTSYKTIFLSRVQMISHN